EKRRVHKYICRSIKVSDLRMRQVADEMDAALQSAVAGSFPHSCSVVWLVIASTDKHQVMGNVLVSYQVRIGADNIKLILVSPNAGNIQDERSPYAFCLQLTQR